MKTDGLFTIHSYKIVADHKKPFHLVIFGDVHRDSPNHANGAWSSFLEHAGELKNAYFIGLGDYLDSTSSSERTCLGATAASMHETLLNDLQQLQDEKIKLLSNELAFMKGRIIGLVNGNHFFQFNDGTNSDQRLCRELQTTYLGVNSFVRLYIQSSTGNSMAHLDMWLHHGASSGRLPGGSINRVDQMREYAEADIFVSGHDHRRGAFPATPRLYLDHNSKVGLRVRERQQWLVRSGSFLASYEPNVRNYNVDACRGPCSLGHVELIITPSFDRVKGGETTLKIQGLA